jgi:predicted acyltransferase
MSSTLTTAARSEFGSSTLPISSRLVSLDLFRGATIALMILVNNPGDELTSYPQLRHADWNGWTLTDLVFPFFLFIVGVSMAFSFRSRLERGASRQQLLVHVLWRSLALFAIGLCLNGFPNEYHLGSWRVYGVLQRIAVCYMLTAALALYAKRSTWIAATVVCLVGYWVLMRYVPVPGFGIPTHDMPILDPDRNLAAWFDRKLLMGHLYEGTRDPEGIISTIPALATCLLGLLTGSWLRSDRSPQTKVRGMAFLGTVAFTAGEFFNHWFPINKKLWTSSYVLLTAGLALVCLAASYWIVDTKKLRGRWTSFFQVFGMNAIAAYVFAEIISHCLDRFSAGGGVTWQEWLYQHTFAPLFSPTQASFLYGISYLLLCWLAMWVLYRKKIFLKI